MNVVAIWTQSIDGFITSDESNSLAWRTSEDREWFAKTIRLFDASIVGRKTYDSVGKPTVGRRRLVFTRDPELLASPNENNRSYCFCSPEASVQRLKSEGHTNVAILGGNEIYSQFIVASCIDELWITIHPVILGSGIRSSLTGRTIQLLQFESHVYKGGLLECRYKIPR